MHSTHAALCDPAAEAAVATLETSAAQIAQVHAAALSNADRLTMLQRLETVQRALSITGLELLAQLDEHWSTNEYTAGPLSHILADRLLITPLEARARTRTAEDLAHRTTLLGEVLPPRMPHTAAAVTEGAIGAAHVKIIRDFLRHLPSSVDSATRTQTEAQLSGFARELRPDQLRKVADKLDAILNPDGTFTDTDRSRRRSFTLGPQGPDLMSTVKGLIDPETRAYLEAIFAKYAKPGVLNPDDITPVTDGDPDPEAQQSDPRSPAQRQHDSVKTILREALASGRLGQHRGLPVTVIVSMTLKELEDALSQANRHTADAAAGTGAGATTAGTAIAGTGAVGATAADRHQDPGPLGIPRKSAPSNTVGGAGPRTGPLRAVVSDVSGPPVTTGGGTLLPIRDALRLAAHAYHYLALFDDHDARPLYLARTKRIATADQRIILHARDIGCTFPGCAKPGYLCETHHLVEWAAGGTTDADQLTFACTPHHRLAGTSTRHWAARAVPPGHPHAGRTHWIPPTHIDPTRQPRINRYHHPSEYLTPIAEPSRRSG